jgi:hypothetical protein
VKLKSVLQILGAGLTGVYLALKIQRPRKSYREFLQLYGALSIDFLYQLESALIETMLASVEEKDRSELDTLLDRQATFQEKMRFFQQHLDSFNNLVIKALSRFYELKRQGLVASAVRKRAVGLDRDTFDVAVDQLFLDLEEAFTYSMTVNLPEKTAPVTEILSDERTPLTERLRIYLENFDNFGSVVFDAFSRFECKVLRPTSS